MDILQQLFRGKCIPASELGGNTSQEYNEALERHKEIVEKMRSCGVPDELIQALDKAENELLALEEERIFCFAMKYGAKIQRSLL